MNKTDKKLTETLPKLTQYDCESIKHLKENPHATDYQIGKHNKELGLSKSGRKIYERLKQSDYLRRAFHEIRAANLEFLSREVTPEALKIHRKVLRDKSIEDKDKKDWVAMALRAEFKPSDSPGQQTTVNIGQMQILQQIMRGVLGGGDVDKVE